MTDSIPGKATDEGRDVKHQSELGDSICSLIDKARDGCEQSHTSLLEQLRAYMAIVASSKMNATFQAKFGESDVVQQSLAIAIEKFDDFRGQSEGELLAWVKQILNRELMQNQRALRSEKRDLFRERSIDPNGGQGNTPADGNPAGPTMPIIDHRNTPGTAAIQQEQSAAISKAMEHLPDEYQQVIRWRNWEQMTFQEIAERMNRSTNAVTKLWYRALIDLRKQIEKLEQPDD